MATGGTDFVGIDLGAHANTCVALDAQCAISDMRVFAGIDVDEAAEWAVATGRVIAIDAPDAPSTRPHLTDPAELSNKFRPARCAEIALGREHRLWVSWVTPAAGPFSSWMQVGFDLFAEVRARGVEPLEVYPHSIFRTLAGKKLPSKQTWDGRVERIALLSERGLVIPFAPAWSHDSLDAAAAAVVARDFAFDEATRVTCGHDSSAIWLPKAPPPSLS